MDSLPPRGPQVGAPAVSNEPPLRFACIYFSNGVDPAQWWAKGEGAAMEFGQAAQPLTPFREDLVFIRGLYHQTALTSTSPHLGRMNMLSAATATLDPNTTRLGTSMDQVIAPQIRTLTPAPTL